MSSEVLAFTSSGWRILSDYEAGIVTRLIDQAEADETATQPWTVEEVARHRADLKAVLDATDHRRKRVG